MGDVDEILLLLDYLVPGSWYSTTVIVPGRSTTL